MPRILLLLTLLSLPITSHADPLSVGAAKIDVTPQNPRPPLRLLRPQGRIRRRRATPLRPRPRHRLDPQDACVLVTIDATAISATLTDAVATRVLTQLGIPPRAPHVHRHPHPRRPLPRRHPRQHLRPAHPTARASPHRPVHRTARQRHGQRRHTRPERHAPRRALHRPRLSQVRRQPPQTGGSRRSGNCPSSSRDTPKPARSGPSSSTTPVTAPPSAPP